MVLSIPASLKKLSRELIKHPKDYTPGHILLTILNVGEGSISRTGLQKMFGLGEGSVKSMIKCMKKYGLIKTSATGSRLTRKGIKLLKLLRYHAPRLRKVGLDKLSVGKVNYAVVLRKKRTFDALKIRDMVVRLGGTGAVLLSIKHGVFKIPYVAEDLKSISTKDYEKLSEMNPKDDDFILIVGGDDDRLALSALGSILFELLIRQA